MPENAPTYAWANAPATGDNFIDVSELITLGMLGDPPAEVRAALDAHLKGSLASLELHLNRPMNVRTFTETIVVDYGGRVYLSQSPVVSITSVTADGLPATLYGGLGLDPRIFLWHEGVVVVVVYRAGLDTSRYATAIKAAVLHKALPYAKALLASIEAVDPETPVEAGGGLAIPAPVPGIKQFAVEGLQVTYESDSEITNRVVSAAQKMASAALWTREEAFATGIPRKPVMA